MTDQNDHSLRRRIDRLYNGRSQQAVRFRYALLALDIVAISFFLLETFVDREPLFVAIEVFFGIVYLVDLAARLYIAKRFWAELTDPITIADIIVIFSLFVHVLAHNFAFLRVLRALRLLRSYRVIREIRSNFPFVRRNETLLVSIVNLAVFIFVATAFVFEFQVGRNPQITNYVDALYFTVTTLTTTGFGDITLTGSAGRLISVLMMIFGISLFLRLLQAIFRPNKVYHKCRQCGLTRHEPDAIHCKHCGALIDIPSEGDSL